MWHEVFVWTIDLVPSICEHHVRYSEVLSKPRGQVFIGQDHVHAEVNWSLACCDNLECVCCINHQLWLSLIQWSRELNTNWFSYLEDISTWKLFDWMHLWLVWKFKTIVMVASPNWRCSVVECLKVYWLILVEWHLHDRLKLQWQMFFIWIPLCHQ